LLKLVITLFALVSVPSYAANELMRSFSAADISTFPNSVCEIMAQLRTRGFVAINGTKQIDAVIFALEMQLAAEHRGVQFKNGKSYGINAVSAITHDVIEVGKREDTTPLTQAEHKSLERQLFGQAEINLGEKEMFDYISEAERIVAENATEPGWTNGDPHSTFWGGHVRAVPNFLVGRLISGFEVFGPRLTFFAGKVRKVFMTDFPGAKALIYAELETRGGDIITVPLTFSGKDYAFNIFGDAVPKNWYKNATD